MINWLIQTTTHQPTPAGDELPVGFLSWVERERLAGFRHPKRRRDWLLGRWTAKRLLQSHLHKTTGVAPPLTRLTIGNDPDGAPFAALVRRHDRPELLWRLPLSLSISHSGDRAFSALWAGSNVAVGADIERIERRDEALATTFFAPAEIALIRSAPPARRDMLITTIWSAKEAALKALRLGLRADTRRIVCLPPVLHPLPTNWTPVDIRCDPTLLPGDPTSFTLSGWWRIQGDYALTLAMLVREEKVK